jgi:hypothetical protein
MAEDDFCAGTPAQKNSVPENMGPSGVSRSGLILTFIRVYPR